MNIASGHARVRSRLKRVAWVMDNSIRLPGGFRIGLDALIGLVPGIGDLLSAIIAFYIIAEAAMLRVPVSVLARMGLNLLVDLVTGIVPVAGDVFDAAFKANLRNVRLLETHLDDPDATHKQSRWMILAMMASIVLVLALIVFGIFAVAAWVLSGLPFG